jgi:phospholipase C
MKKVVGASIALLAYSALAVACSGGKTATREAASVQKSPCELGPITNVPIPIVPSAIHPSGVSASKFETATPIKHVVFIMKENRTFDNLFGAFPGADGASTGLHDGSTVSLRSHCFAQRIPKDMVHDYPMALASLNGGKMDGFGPTAYSAEWAYTQAQERDIPNYWRWAQDFAIGDNFFASILGPSFPNHLYSIAATANGTHDNPVLAPTAANPAPNDVGGYADWAFKSWGCDSPESTYVLVDSDRGRPKKKYPCFDMTAVPDTLERAGVPWAYYGANDTQGGYFWVAPDYIDHIRNNPAQWSHVYGVDHLIPDITDGHLPPVTWVTPEFWLSDHPDASLCYGENWTTEVVNAIMSGPMWKDTAVFISWDDWGGFYDHVVPPKGLGFRVPVMTISPYAKRGYIDKTQGDFSSILRFIERNWGLDPLTKGEPDPGNDMTQNFNFKQTPLAADPLPTRHDCQGQGSVAPPFDPN